ncbi:MAG TPA: 50S ribosomal protein L9 [Bacteroidetes bacterium]|nr:50S ribosomal protein L9 [Bacteroidota bacterium]
MEIILLKNIEKVGRKFEIQTVKNGYGRNYLIPQGLAVIANKANRNKLDGFKRMEAAKLEKMLDVFKEIAAKVNGQTLDIPVKCGTSGKIFGSITTLAISRALKAQLDVDVDRRDILLPEDAKMIGVYTAVLDLHPDIDSKVDFEMKPDDPKVAAIIEENRQKEAEEAAETARKNAEAEAVYAAEEAEKEAAKAAEAAAAAKENVAETATEAAEAVTEETTEG